MEMPFSKYHGLGNDFIAIDNRGGDYDERLRDKRTVRALCGRRTGVGADGVLEMRESCMTGSSLRMVYYNADGGEGSFCGNGARCFIAYAVRKCLVQADEVLTFEACDGIHRGWLDGTTNIVHLHMADVKNIRVHKNGDYFLDTGSPHHVRFVDDLDRCDVRTVGAEIRYGPLYPDGGANANFVEVRGASLAVRTYERGVEDETLACGTGLTAVCLANHNRQHGDRGYGQFSQTISCRGGEASVDFRSSRDHGYTDVLLSGPACHVYNGSIGV